MTVNDVHVTLDTLEPGKLTFCTDIGYAPMQFVRDGELVGLEIDLAREVAGRLGLEARFVDQRFDGIVDALYAGSGDAIVCAVSDSAERRERLTFVHYFTAGQTVVVRKGNPEGVHTVEDLAGLRVLVQEGTSNSERLRELDAENQLQGLAPMFIAGFHGTTGETTERASRQLRAGHGDADFLDVVNALWRVGRHEELEATDVLLDEEPYGFCFRKDDTVLQTAVHGVVVELYGDSTIDALLEKWDLAPVGFADPALVRVNG